MSAHSASQTANGIRRTSHGELQTANGGRRPSRVEPQGVTSDRRTSRGEDLLRSAPPRDNNRFNHESRMLNDSDNETSGHRHVLSRHGNERIHSGYDDDHVTHF